MADTGHIGEEPVCGSENHRIEDCLRRSEQDNQDSERLFSSQDLSAPHDFNAASGKKLRMKRNIVDVSGRRLHLQSLGFRTPSPTSERQQC